MNNFLVDTTVLVEQLRGNQKAKQFLKENLPAISSVSHAELIQGVKKKSEFSNIHKLIADLQEQLITEAITKNAIILIENFHLSHGLLFPDALIATTAQLNNCTLVTQNVKHFHFIPKLKILDWNKVFEKN